MYCTGPGDLRAPVHGAVRISGGKLQAIEPLADQRADLRYGDLLISPGLIDMHTHMDEPGREAWEGEPPTTPPPWTLSCARGLLKQTWRRLAAHELGCSAAAVG